MTDEPLLYLKADDVRRALPMPEAIEAMRQAFTQLASGKVVMPARGRIDFPEKNGLMLLMPCHSQDDGRLTLKVIHQFADNRAFNLPLIQALVLLGDAGNGRFLAILDGAALTAIRTGAAAGLATKVLAREDAGLAAILGAGVQARAQLEAMCAVRSLSRARVYDYHAAAAEAFAAEMSARLGIAVEAAPTPAQALRDALVVCTATTSSSPVFTDQDLAPGAHLNGVGSWNPQTAEIPADTVCRARIFVDREESALEEAGDLVMPLRDGRLDRARAWHSLGDLLLGRVPGRQNPEEITLFKSVGLAVQDLFAASRAVANARRLGLGIELPR